MKRLALISFLTFLSLLTWCQEVSSDTLAIIKDTVYIDFLTDSLTDREQKHRLNTLLITGSAVYASSLTGLYFLWYADYPQSSFHLFNDNHEWLQFDKAGHSTASYYIGNIGYKSLLWAGMEDKKAIWIGGFAGSAYMSIIEILDGFSVGWGASYGDIIANTSGSLLFSAQQATWGKQNIKLKLSYWPSPYTKYRPDILGNNFIESSLKDYNGITSWMSVNLKTFFEKKESFPDWICVSLGYGTDGILGAVSNADTYLGQPLPHFERERQFYLSADIDLTRLPIKSKFLRSVTEVFSVLKIPFPALEYNKSKGMVFHPLFY